MGDKEFDYYIYIDYSEEFLGYMIIEKGKVREFISKISKFAHYKELKHKSAYLQSIKKRIEREKIRSYILKLKIKDVKETPEIYADLVEFIKKNDNCLIFISVDDKQYSNFERLVKNIDGKNNKIIKESELKKDGREYRMSLVLDTLLNLARIKNGNH